MQPRLENRCWLEGNGSTRPRYFLASRRHYRWKLLGQSAALMADPSYDKPAALFHPSSLLFKLLSSLPWKCVFFLSSFHRSPESPTFRSRDRDVTVGSWLRCKPRFIWVDLSVSCVHEKEKNDLLLASLIYRPSGAGRFSLMPPRTPLRLSCYTGIRLIADWSPRIEDIYRPRWMKHAIQWNADYKIVGLGALDARVMTTARLDRIKVSSIYTALLAARGE